MRIGLIDVDGHRFPNLALMKLSAYHKERGDSVEWWNGFARYDLVYQAKVFTGLYSPDVDTVSNTDGLIKGGTGYRLSSRLPDPVEHHMPDYALYPQYQKAYGYLTRGCPRGCPFCIVKEKEGPQSVRAADLSEFYTGQKEICLLDPNLLACPEHPALLRQLIDSRARVDFTQGLDARLLTEENAAQLKQVRIAKLSFAFDDLRQEDGILRGLVLFRRITGKQRSVNVFLLTNFDTTHEQDLYRVRKVQELGYLPYIMIYNKPSAPQLTRDLQRWCNNRFIYRATEGDFSKYRKGAAAIGG